MIVSPQMLWKEFDRKFMPLDTSVLSSVSGADFCEQSFYFNGGASAASNARIFARISQPSTNNQISSVIKDSLSQQPSTQQKIDGKNCLIIMPDFDQDITKLSLGATGKKISVMIVDWAGDYDGRSRHTIYPKSMSYANFNPLTYTSAVPQKTSNCCWFAWACTLLRAITFLQSEGFDKIGVIGLGVGSDSVWKAASYDNSITAAACFLDSGLENFKDNSSTIQLDFLAAIQAINYAPNINCPLFMLAETNATGGSFDKLIEQYNAINRADKLLYILQRADSFLNSKIVCDLKIWFSYYLYNVGSLPQVASITTKKSENNLYYQVLAAGLTDATQATVHYTQGLDTTFRYWRSSKLDSVSQTEFIGKVNIFSIKQKLLAYANITFLDGFCCSTPLITLENTQLSGFLPLQYFPRRLIYDSEMGLDNFISIGSSSALCMQVGYNNISGLALESGCILTYKIGDVLYSAHGVNSIQFIICSYSVQDIIFKVTDSITKNVYFAKKQISAQDEWLKIILSLSDFKNVNSSISSFDSCSLLEIFADNKIIINTILWI